MQTTKEGIILLRELLEIKKRKKKRASLPVRQRIVGKMIVLSSPYSSEAPPRFRNIGGKWDPSSKTWQFPLAAQAVLNKTVKEIYGVTGLETDVAPARITALKRVTASRDSIRFYGFVLASGYGRDSGAKTGQHVILEDGEIGTGGSAKNWITYIDNGAVFLIEEFPIGLENTTEFEINYVGTGGAEPEGLQRNPRLVPFSDEELVAEIKARNIRIN